MSNVVLVGDIDIAMLSLWAFFLFFIALVFYLRRQDRLEGYPLEDTVSGRVDTPGGPLATATHKTFYLPFERGSVTTPTKGREPVDIAARRIDRFPGAPYAPTGNPLLDGIGPAAWAERARVPDLDVEGDPRIVPLSVATNIRIDTRDPNPIGMTVTGADNVVAGTVAEVWVDRADRLIRYLAVDLGARTVLAPMTMAKIDRRRRNVKIDALLAAQFADAPAIDGADVITLYEEERVQAYFGGGYLYATPERQEPFL